MIRNGMTVSVHFIDGRVDEIRYYKVNPKNSKKTICPSEAEVNILLRANAQDTTWELELAQRGDTLWRNRKKGLSAFRTPQALTISIADPAAYKAFHERSQLQETWRFFNTGEILLFTSIGWILALKI
jgi:hypothetical protein